MPRPHVDVREPSRLNSLRGYSMNQQRLHQLFDALLAMKARSVIIGRLPRPHLTTGRASFQRCDLSRLAAGGLILPGGEEFIFVQSCPLGAKRDCARRQLASEQSNRRKAELRRFRVIGRAKARRAGGVSIDRDGDAEETADFYGLAGGGRYVLIRNDRRESIPRPLEALLELQR